MMFEAAAGRGPVLALFDLAPIGDGVAALPPGVSLGRHFESRDRTGIRIGGAGILRVKRRPPRELPAPAESGHTRSGDFAEML